MKADVRNLILQAESGAGRPEDEVKVLVALSVAEPDETCLRELRSLGLDVSEVIANKIVGSIRQDRIESLSHHRAVAEVEPSVTLKLH